MLKGCKAFSGRQGQMTEGRRQACAGGREAKGAWRRAKGAEGPSGIAFGFHGVNMEQKQRA